MEKIRDKHGELLVLSVISGKLKVPNNGRFVIVISKNAVLKLFARIKHTTSTLNHSSRNLLAKVTFLLWPVIVHYIHHPLSVFVRHVLLLLLQLEGIQVFVDLPVHVFREYPNIGE